MLAFLSLASSCGSQGGKNAVTDLSQPHQYVNPAGDEFPIIAWDSNRPYQATRQRFEEMKEAGFNVAYAPGLDSAMVHLEAAAGTGIKVIVQGDYLNPETVPSRCKDHPALAGYYIIDEPLAKDLNTMVTATKRLRAVDDGHVLYMNLLPSYTGDWNKKRDLITERLGGTYDHYLDMFLDGTGVGLLSYDYYPIVDKGEGPFLKDTYYRDLYDISRKAIQKGIPFWAFTWSRDFHQDEFPFATREWLRMQLFSDLAFGAQGVQYFTYEKGLIYNGVRNEIWDYAKEINAEIQNLKWVFLEDRFVDAWHVGDSLYEGVKPLDMSVLPEFKEISTSGGDTVITRLDKGDDHFLMVLNGDIHERQKVTVIPAMAGMERVLPDGSVAPASRWSENYWLGVGDYILLRWK